MAASKYQLNERPAARAAHGGRRARHAAGFTLIEVLVALLVTVLGLLGLAGLQARIQQAELESYQRTQALVLLYDMVDRVSVHRATAPCFRITTDPVAGDPYLGVGAAAPPACGFSGIAAVNAFTDVSILEWDNLLKGAAETKGGISVGAMIGARGCVSYDVTTELIHPVTLLPIDGTGIYTVAVSWQGTSDTFAPTVNCANTLYGPETRRRTVSATFRLAELT